MQVILQVRNGSRAGQVFQLRAGQAGRFGRSEWCDFPIPEASRELADEHFVVTCEVDSCTIENLAGDEATNLNGKPCDTAPLVAGDVVTAGGLEFAVFVEGGHAPDVADVPAEPAPAPAKRTPADVAALLGLSDPALEAAAAADDEMALLDTLVESDLFPDGVRLTAFLLEKPVAIAWAVDCLRGSIGDSLPAADAAALAAAARWAGEPSEENRRAANAAAEATDYSTGATWVALAAFWSEGSIAPEGLPDVPPGETLTSQGITGGLMMAATSAGSPEAVDERYKTFLASGREKL